MSLGREVFIRILALLQRKTSIETKNCTLKCLKWHYLTEDGAFALFFSPHSGGGGVWQLKSPHPREFVIQGQKKCQYRGSARWGGVGGVGGAGHRWNWLMHNNINYDITCHITCHIKMAKLHVLQAPLRCGWASKLGSRNRRFSLKILVARKSFNITGLRMFWKRLHV